MIEVFDAKRTRSYGCFASFKAATIIRLAIDAMIVPKPPTFTPIKSIFGSFAKLDSITVAGTFETI